ncbi:two-component system OmpR family sensor kinase [Saccharothrix ecbatanensis]|uniref:histidine kinase n=1 Tax=Saccharothrix ecbatanensis TaxID=1105145 RepID=A0A7W9HTC7_9PSEU|nr:HAMP domain-containing sensor histidine kinase [Saccharothrix ecbatanensis]MBB5808102.1 two-component system OmpR family sensor kinase [Saccharothrix ecbatanensis]
MSLRARLILIVSGLSALGVGLAVGATFGALQDWDKDVYGPRFSEISRQAEQLHAQEYDELTSRVAGVAIISSIGTVLAVIVASAFAVKRGLRPLDDIAATADKIGSGDLSRGDLSRRVPIEEERTEIGRLGGALNAMLGQVESAFRDKEASEARLRRFIADASHELRTPIATIRGYAELFHRGAAERPDDLAKVTSRIESEAKRMGTLVDELLLLARLDQGLAAYREPVDLTVLAADAVADAAARAPGRSLRVEQEGAVVVSGDTARLRQVLANLLSNVLQHTPPESSSTVRVHVEGEDAVVEVADTGPGLESDECARVFERFFRTDAARARDGGGAGLGLSIVESVVVAHGGRVGVTSDKGVGTTFRITLPLDRVI